jgi:hypothetical protein
MYFWEERFILQELELLRREAATSRLVREASVTKGPHRSFHRAALARLGRWLVAFGSRLVTRYDVPQTPTTAHSM